MDLKEFMFKNKLSNVKLAKLIGCSKGYMSDMKRGIWSPGMLMILKILYISKGTIELEELVCEKDWDDFHTWKDSIEKKILT